MAARTKPWSLEKPNLLIVEGYSDLHFTAEFLEHLGDHTTTDIYEVGGRGNFERLIPELLQPPTLSVAQYVGIILDADDSAAGAFHTIQTVIKRCVDIEVASPGIWTGTRPSYGIFVCPDGTRPGELETGAWEAWATDPANSSHTDCVEGYLECVRKAGVRIKSPDKVRVGTMLAVRNEDDPRIGPGARARIFNFESPALMRLKEFLAPLTLKHSRDTP